MGRVAVRERYGAVSLWIQSKCSRLSHGKTQTRRFEVRHVLVIPVEEGQALASLGGVKLQRYDLWSVPSDDAVCDPRLVAGRGVTDIRLERPVLSAPSQHSLIHLRLPRAPSRASPEPRSWLQWLSSDA